MSDPKPSDRSFFKWFVSRELWYDVVKTIVSAFMVVFVGALIGAIGGLNYDSYTAPLVAFLLILTLLLTVSATASLVTAVLAYRAGRRAQPRLAALWAASSVGALLMVGILVVQLIQFNNDFS